MKKSNLLQRVIIILVVTIGGLYLVIGPYRRPKASDFTRAGIKNTLAENIHLGLDLKGGSHLVMRVKVEDMFKQLANDNAAVAQRIAEEKAIKVSNARSDTSNGYRFMVTVEDPSRLKELQDEVTKK